MKPQKQECKYEIPRLPQGLVDAYNQGNLAIFIGAGISRLMGCEGWDSMADNLIQAVCAAGQANQIINSSLSSKAKITIAKRLAEKDKEKEKKFWKIFKKAITAKSRKDDIYDTIRRLDTLFVTTNCDGLLVRYFEQLHTVECTLERLDEHKEETYLFCLHGNYGKGRRKELDTLVFTEDEYLKKYRYGSEHAKFVRELMRSKTVLFLGYGLNEFEILSAAFEDKTSEAPKHYVLEGFFGYQSDYRLAVEEYYKSVGIQLISYNKDDKAYWLQKDIIESWIEELENKTSYNSRGVEQVNKALSTFTPANKNLVLHEISREDDLGKAYKEAMFQQLPKEETCFDWIYWLLTEGIINEKSMPDESNQSWSLLLCISRCLKSQKINNKQKINIQGFVQLCIDKAITPGVKVSTFIYGQLVELVLQLNISLCGEKEALIQDWIEFSVDGGYRLLTEYFEAFSKWRLGLIYKVIAAFYEKYDETTHHSHDYWFDKFAEKMVKAKMNQKVILKAAKTCSKVFLSEVDGYDYYRCFADRMNLKGFGAVSQLEKSISIFLQGLGCDELKKYFEWFASMAKDSIQLQVLFHYTAKFSFNVTEYMRDNPLSKKNVFVDFYFWLYEFTKLKKFNDSNREILAGWILAADFGRQLNETKEDIWKERIRKTNNTWKCQLLELINDNDAFTKQLRQLKEEGIYDLKTPVEDEEQYHTIHDVPPDVYFSDVDLSTLQTDELINLALKEVRRVLFGEHKYHEIMRAMFSKIEENTIESVITSLFSRDEEMLLIGAESLDDEELIKRLGPERVQRILVKYYQTVCGFEKKKHQKLVQIYVDILRKLENSGWSARKIFEFVVGNDFKSLFPIEEKSHENMDVLMDLINTPEGEFCNLLIEKAADCKDKPSVKRAFLGWMEQMIENTKSKWFVFSCAFNFQRLAYIDYEYTQINVFPLYEQTTKKESICLCLTLGSSVIIREISHYLAKDDHIERVTSLFTESKENAKVSVSYIKYIAASYYFEYIGIDDYQRLIKTLPLSLMHHLVWSVLFGIKDADESKQRDMLRYILQNRNTEIDKKTISHDIISAIGRKKAIDKKWWEVIEGIMTDAYEDTQIWGDICECLEKTKNKNDMIPKVMHKLKNSPVIPYEYTVYKAMYWLAKLDYLNEVKLLVGYAIKHSIDPIDMMQYDKNPEKILRDYKLDE